MVTLRGQGINYARVCLGGLVAGLLLAAGESVLATVVLSDEWDATAVDPDAMAYGTLLSLALVGVVVLNGFVLIWLYAAIRPRFGPGPTTAVIAGFTLWLIAWALMGVSLTLSGVVTPRVAVISAIWGLFEVPLAALAGAWLYREVGAAASAA
ncbi:hypothetical protein OEZ71_15540 [Defluviimonas sp. WL0050]|uniref:Uncharacterized protein n=1 Tax=Albidovulum litorale TaxID=2984134 RepID=A0ABT2ZRN9_9RHOB|nr:hypothetical protein [Defluviimonas sp. WL0050]MCV2873712.1 hypothetical protein [Defluviimonas sp. WL0050]